MKNAGHAGVFLSYYFTLLALNLLMAFLVNSLSTRRPLIAARSASSISQCSVPCQNIFFVKMTTALRKC